VFPFHLVRVRALQIFAAASIVYCVTLQTGAAAANDGPVRWWKDAVFYEIFVRSFADATDGPLSGDGIGDFQGLIERLDYLNDGGGENSKSLNVDAIWLMPIHPSPSYHGYDVMDYFAVNPQFGDIELFKRFLAEAHRRGIRVIIDFVPNHASSQHPLFRKAVTGSPDGNVRGYFRFADMPQELFGPWEQRAWHPSNAADGSFFYGVFSSDMPDWNFHDPRVTDHHHRAAKFWLEEIGVDGLRLDAVRYLHEVGEALQDTAETRQWLKEFTAYCHSVKPDAFIIGENTAHMPEVARSILGGSVDSSFEFDLARATIESVRLRTPQILSRALRQLEKLYGMERPWATLLTNHDQERTRTQLGGSESMTRLATKLWLTLPGVPFLYYGEELGMQAAKPDPDLRTPMPWTGKAPNAGFAREDVKAWKPPQADFPMVNVATQSGEPDSMLGLYRRLVRLNQSSPALRHGKTVTLETTDRGVYAEMRETVDEVILVLGNFSEAAKRGVGLSADKTGIRPEWTLKEEVEGTRIAAPDLTASGGFTAWHPLPELAPESVYVLRWRR
jgi:glycosidase